MNQLAEAPEHLNGVLPVNAPRSLPPHRVVIEPGHIEKQYWLDLWRYRELMYFLAWRDIAVRYRQTAVGVLWALVRPLSTVLIFTLVFRKIAGLTSEENISYPLLIFAGMLPWQLFAGGFGNSCASLVSNSNMISKVYFPRLAVPLSALAGSVAEFVIGLPIFFAMMLWLGVMPTWRLLFLPLFLFLVLACAIGPGLCLAALNVRYRDVGHLVPFVLQLGLYLSPVGFTSDKVDEPYHFFYMLNPMASLIDAFRWSLLGTRPPFAEASFWLSMLVVAALLLFGIKSFRRMERTFADVI